MVMPCSRSERRPSVSRARSTYSSPRRRLIASMWASLSSKIDFESWSRRPISVDLPSSTLPIVAKCSGAGRRTSTPRGSERSSSTTLISEVPLPLAVFHARFRDAIVGPRGAPRGEPGDARLGDDVGDGGRRRLARRRARGVADGPEAHGGLERHLVLPAG